MMIDRRSFIQCTVLAAATPTLATLFPLAPMAEASLVPGPSPEAADPTTANCVVFKIDGWDHCDAELSTGSEVWIRINPSWRSAWR
jgi:hypothetical protein